MSWWELKRLGIAVGAICVIATIVSAGICLALGAFTYQGMGNALFGAAILLASLGTIVGGGVMPSHFPANPSAVGAVNPVGQSFEHGMLAQQSATNISYHLQQFKDMSRVLVFGLASVPLFAASILCLFVLDS